MDEIKTITGTLCYLVHEDMVCLAKKTRKVGVGTRCGYGGKVKAGESLLQCLYNEVLEETNGVQINTGRTEKVAIIDFHNRKASGEIFIFTVHVYLVYDWEGFIQESAEMKDPQMYTVHKLPYDEMMPSDKVWLPLVFHNCTFFAEVHLGPEQKTLNGPICITFVDDFIG